MLLPRPSSITVESGGFSLDASTLIVAPTALRATAEFLQGALRGATGLPLPIAACQTARRPGSTTIALAIDEGLGREAYRLTSSAEGARIVAGAAAGVFYGCQTLLQLLPVGVFRRAPLGHREWTVPCARITDGPRFGWRGALLDVARHFMPKHDVLRFIDLLAMHKLNVLHLHLTDDQGWRVEILRYPLLTEVGGWRRESQRGAAVDSPTDGRPHGGYYSQEDLREIVAYAASRHVTVVPEIELPGHSRAAIAAYPELGVTGSPVEVSTRWGVDTNILNVEDATIQFYRNVFDEIMEVFPSPFICVGGDECPKDQWTNDPRTQQLMRQRGIDGEADLQAWFVTRIAEHLVARGRRLFGWDELLEGTLPEGTVIASWRGLVGAVAAARRGLDVVACPDDRVYLDYRQSERDDEPIPVSIALTVEDAYGFEPCPPGLTAAQSARILGGQANIWTEHMDSPRTVDYFAFPRLAAIAEALWSDSRRDFGEFGKRLAFHLGRLAAVGVEYRPADGPRPWQQRPGVPGRPWTAAERRVVIDALVATIRP